MSSTLLLMIFSFIIFIFLSNYCDLFYNCMYIFYSNIHIFRYISYQNCLQRRVGPSIKDVDVVQRLLHSLVSSRLFHPPVCKYHKKNYSAFSCFTFFYPDSLTLLCEKVIKKIIQHFHVFLFLLSRLFHPPVCIISYHKKTLFSIFMFYIFSLSRLFHPPV